MNNEKYIIDEECFEGPRNTVIAKNYGDEYDPWEGLDVIEFTKEDIDALLEGKVLETSCCNEYGVLIRMEKAVIGDE